MLLLKKNDGKIYFLVTIFLFILFCLQIHFFYPNLFLLDDPYIVLHSAQVMHLGYDPNYSGSVALTGNSSPVNLFFTYLWLFIVPPIYALILTNWCAILIYVWGMIYLSSLYRCTTLQTWLIIICSLGSGSLLFHLVNGLESALTLAAMTWALVLCSLAISQMQRISLALLLGILPFIRPELIVFSVLIYSFQWSRYQKNNCLCLKNILQDGFFVFIVAFPWIFWLWHDLHQLYPLTISAKRIFFTDHDHSIAERFFLLARVLKNFYLEICPVYLLALFLLGYTALGRFLFLFMLIFLCAYLLTSPLVLENNDYRYLYLFIPLLLFGFLSTLRDQKMLVYGAAHIAISFLAIIVLVFAPLKVLRYDKLTKSHAQLMQAYTTWCVKNIPSNAIVVVQDAGYIAYATSLHLSDFVGLKSPANIAIQKKYSEMIHASSSVVAAIAEIMVQNHAHYLIMTRDWADHLHVLSQLNALGLPVKVLKTFSETNEAHSYTYVIYYLYPNHLKTLPSGGLGICCHP